MSRYLTAIRDLARERKTEAAKRVLALRDELADAEEQLEACRKRLRELAQLDIDEHNERAHVARERRRLNSCV